MNDESINGAIAEHLGWMRHPTCKKVWRTPEQCERNRELIGTVSGPWSTESSGPPNFCRDLNAMHEAEKALTLEQVVDYCAFTLRRTTGEGCVTDYKMIMATARQRAEAFLRTVGKWKENE